MQLNKPNHLPISKKEARSKGLRPLTKPYEASEYPMMESVIGDMRRGGINHAKVSTNGGIEIWRG